MLICCVCIPANYPGIGISWYLRKRLQFLRLQGRLYVTNLYWLKCFTLLLIYMLLEEPMLELNPVSLQAYHACCLGDGNGFTDYIILKLSGCSLESHKPNHLLGGLGHSGCENSLILCLFAASPSPLLRCGKKIFTNSNDQCLQGSDFSHYRAA